MFDVVTIAVMTVAVIILGLSKGGFAGIGMVSTPMVAAATDPITAVGLILPILLVQDAVAMTLYRREFDRTLLFRLIPGGLLGIVFAYYLASTVPDWGIKLVLGAVSFVFAVWQIIVLLRGIRGLRVQGTLDPVFGLLAGIASGFASSIAHAGSPPFQIYVMPKQLKKEIYVGTSVMFFASLNAMKLPSFAALGLMTPTSLKFSAVFIPLAILSSWLGAWLIRRIQVRSFNMIITIILFVIGIILLTQGINEYTRR